MAQRIELTGTDGHRLGAWLAPPDGTPRGALVVVQEIFGVNAHIRAVTERFAEHGYLAIAPMLFDREQAGVELPYDEAAVAEGRRLVAAIGFDNALRDVAAAARHVGAAREKVGVVGYCWGGTVAFLANTRMKMPAVSYYGGRSVPFLHERPGAPLMMHFGERDPIIPPADLAKTRAALPEAEIHVYPAGHGFNCDQRKDYDARCAALALERTLAFFAKHLA
jgi:carboxymethylenebutenolidase